MSIEQFMRNYREAWENQDDAHFAALFTAEGEYHNTPFAVQRGHGELVEYWQRVKLQQDIHVTYEIIAPEYGIARWHVEYQVASEELFRVWARSTGTNLVERTPGGPLPRIALDGVLQAEFEGELCRVCRIWWHSIPQDTTTPKD
ncbi:YybH family protein [Nonomuraea basaltis]|uniref:YybH family protein n=1 Tax=Nonomuraea basaltis TaxID=2495887 RepID=UPI00110C6F3C|nr:nuclear transport factor 2 family protein [Nonomuraea basaltis]TMR99116.1 nuclear transport factor 2 family protein [Nonomuraea basaltis]